MWCKLLDQGTASPPPFFLEKNKKKSHLFYLLFDFCWCCCCCLLLLCLQIFKKLSSFAKLKIDLNKVKKQNKNQYNFYKLLLLFLESPSMFVKKYIFFFLLLFWEWGEKQYFDVAKINKCYSKAKRKTPPLTKKKQGHKNTWYNATFWFIRPPKIKGYPIWRGDIWN